MLELVFGDNHNFDYVNEVITINLPQTQLERTLSEINHFQLKYLSAATSDLEEICDDVALYLAIYFKYRSRYPRIFEGANSDCMSFILKPLGIWLTLEQLLEIYNSKRRSVINGEPYKPSCRFTEHVVCV